MNINLKLLYHANALSSIKKCLTVYRDNNIIIGLVVLYWLYINTALHHNVPNSLHESRIIKLHAT